MTRWKSSTILLRTGVLFNLITQVTQSHFNCIDCAWVAHGLRKECRGVSARPGLSQALHYQSA
jgi:hypothetical protein